MNERSNPAATAFAAVERILGEAPGIVREIEEDFALLERVESGTEAAGARAWTTGDAAAVVLGVSLDPLREVHLEACEASGVAVLRRRSGGGAVLLGPGTVQYAFALAHHLDPALESIDGSKRLCNAMLLRALRAAGVAAALREEDSGDFSFDQRKVAGLALRRRRRATLVHGTILRSADLCLVGSVLRHPSREPAYRVGRRHEDFLANLGPFDERIFARSLREAASALTA